MALRRNARAIAAIGGGVAAAAGLIFSAVFLPPHYKMKVVPRHFAALTRQQKIIQAFARKDGVGSGILYVWGGTTTRGFDCSGFIYHVEGAAGIRVPRTSQAMWYDGGKRVPRRDLRVGDVLFFSFSGGAPGHVGLSLGGAKFVEYYTSGRPARYGRLPKFGYIGARRWYTPLRVRKRTFHPAMWVARRWHLKIAGSIGDTVVFVSRHKHHHRWFALWKRRAILRWAHRHHYRVKGYYSHINIRLHHA